MADADAGCAFLQSSSSRFMQICAGDQRWMLWLFIYFSFSCHRRSCCELQSEYSGTLNLDKGCFK